MKKIKTPFTLLIPFVVVYFIYPEVGKDYSGFWFGGYTGAVHGGTWIYNWIFSFFDSSHLLKAHICSGWYSFCWWIAAISSSFAILIPLLMLVGFGALFAFAKKKSKE